jgi:hypothetical protein
LFASVRRRILPASAPSPEENTVTVRRAALLACSAVLALSACGGTDQDEIDAAVEKALAAQQAEQPAPAEEPAAPVEPAEIPAADAPAAPAPDLVDFVMPDFRGENLQVAQDRVQELGVFFSVSHDVIAMRAQLLDSNWKICTQTPAPGERVAGEAADWEGKIDFGTVKLTETCP